MKKLEDFVVPPLAVVCHDAGGANHIITWLKDYKSEVKACMEGPAKIIWKRNFPDNKLLPIDKVIDGSKTLLSGTGSGDLEHLARFLAKKKNIKNISVIDHWGMYEKRFVINGKELLPDLILVGDKIALDKARKFFPSISVINLPNSYLQIEANLSYSERTRECQTPIENILIIGEPFIDKIPGEEFIAIEFLMSNLNKINPSKNLIKITLRPHPSDYQNKYNFLQEKYKDLVGDFKISRNIELYKDIAWSDLVVGVNSFALMISLTAGVPTMSISPPEYNKPVLQHKNLIYLRDKLD